jgi:hypothetical protein
MAKKYNLYDVGTHVIAEHVRSAIIAIVKGEIMAKSFSVNPKELAPTYSIRFWYNQTAYTSDFEENQIIGFAHEPRL